ncbi:MAG: hypothetical protein CMJ49_03645 [Planctomycetaceae bacterium]|nr:hypothetical protein [Planctomycetaceae bacterium]
MPRNVEMAASLPASSDRLYDMYVDAAAHAAFTGQPVVIEPRAGASFSAFDGVLTGTILQVAPKRLIVQSWRSANWPKEAIDSTLVLSFWPDGQGKGRIELMHINVADDDFAGVSRGWEQYYFAPWRVYLENDVG